MDSAEIVKLYDQSRKEVRFFNLQREETPHLVRHISANGEGMIIYSDLNASNVEDVIHEQIARFESSGQAFDWVVFQHDKPVNLKDRLLAHGFEAEEPEAIMVLDVEHVSTALQKMVNHDVQRIKDPQKIGDVITVREQVWRGDFSSTARNLVKRLRGDPHNIGLYVAYVDGKPVSTAQITFYAHGCFASLGGASTLPDYRKRGLYTALLAIRVQEARKRGIRFLDADASPMSRPILEKFGFQWLTEAHACAWRLKHTPSN
ncbi:MAG: GNAT family N-acetyltransferase [Chloroflexi bacterium]|nr:GNAT family N-acetyltransferase [Chloroflexota bacterium]